MSKKHLFSHAKIGMMLISALLLVPILAGCTLPGGPIIPPTPTPQGQVIPPLSPTPTAEPPIIQPQNTPEASPTGTPLVPIAATPTNTAVVQSLGQGTSGSASVPAGTISFTPGTTAGVKTGTIQPGQVITYTVGGAQSQAMVLILESTLGDVTLGVIGPDGSALLANSYKYTRWQSLLPLTGLYTIQVVGGASTESYTLTVKISEVVNFAVGTSSITLTGTTTNGYLHSYSFSAAAGQVMTASLNVGASTATIDVFGMNTGVLLSPASHANSWSGTLPATQVYVIEVIPTGGYVINYQLTVSITGAGGVIPSPTTNPGPAGSIAFPAGTTGTTVSGTIQPGQMITYTVNAGANLPMILNMVSTNWDVFFQVVAPDGEIVVPLSKHWYNWQSLLYQNGLYRIQIFGGAATEIYSLWVRIPVIIHFAASATSSTITGSTVNGQAFTYGLVCAANQTMAVSLNTPATSAYLDLFGLETGTILDSSSKATSWTTTLPKNQYYLIDVYPAVGGQVVNYTLTVSCTGASSGSSSAIVFSPGATAGVVTGSIAPGQIVSYTIAAAQWQPLVMGVSTPNKDVYLGLFEANGAAVVPPSNHWIHWQGLLPQTETYTIQLTGGATTEAYTLTVKIAQRVNFSLGQSSITVYGTTINGYLQSYAFKATGGQTMTVTIDKPSSEAYIDVFGIATGSLLSPAEKANSWTGVLPAYQDYIIEVIPRNGQLMSFALTVTIH